MPKPKQNRLAPDTTATKEPLGNNCINYTTGWRGVIT